MRDNPTSEQAIEVVKSAKNNDAVAAFVQAAKDARKQVDAWSAAAQKDQDWFLSLAHLSLFVGSLTTAARRGLHRMVAGARHRSAGD